MRHVCSIRNHTLQRGVCYYFQSEKSVRKALSHSYHLESWCSHGALHHPKGPRMIRPNLKKIVIDDLENLWTISVLLPSWSLLPFANLCRPIWKSRTDVRTSSQSQTIAPQTSSPASLAQKTRSRVVGARQHSTQVLF